MDNSLMENQEDNIELPPGFRFHPTDEELITHYLSKKVIDSNFTARAIGDVDLNKCEPWDLPWRAKMGEKQWYFFCVRDRKYPTGLRTNRATEAGYWKATGKDREIYRAKALVGMKKTLVFYRGRAPKGEKTNWVMHEYRLEGKYSLYNPPKTAKNEWVICRIFQKSGAAKKTHVSGLIRMSSSGEDFGSVLPPLMDSPFSNKNNPPHVTCFSSSMEGQIKEQRDVFHSPLFANPVNPSENSMLFSKLQLPNYQEHMGNLQHQNSLLFQDRAFLRAIIESHGSNLKHGSICERDMVSISQETGLSSDINAEISSVVSNYEMGRRGYEETEDPSSSAGPVVDLDCLWNY